MSDTVSPPNNVNPNSIKGLTNEQNLGHTGHLSHEVVVKESVGHVVDTQPLVVSNSSEVFERAELSSINVENNNSEKKLSARAEAETNIEHEKDPRRDTDDIDVSQEDDASVLVIILQCETKSCDRNITNMKWVFSDPYFTVQVCAVDPPPNIPTSKTLTQTQYLENYCMRKALTYAAEGPYLPKSAQHSPANGPNSQGTIEAQYWWSKIPVIIVKDSSVSNITTAGTTDEDHPTNSEDNHIGGMKRRIKVALDRARQADLFFLCKWHDACNKYVDVTGVDSIDHGSNLKWSVQPTSTQAIMYTPYSRDYVSNALLTANVTLSEFLNTSISSGQLLATVFVPNIIDFDIDLATSNADYVKLNECAPVATATTSNASVASFIWFGVIIALILIVAWALIQIGPKYVASPTNDS